MASLGVARVGVARLGVARLSVARAVASRQNRYCWQFLKLGSAAVKAIHNLMNKALPDFVLK